MIKPLQEVVYNMEALHHGRAIDNAAEAQLDILGEIIDQPRRGMADVDYRAWIDVGIKLNQGSGTPEDVLSILTILYRSKPEFFMEEKEQGQVVFTLLKLPMAPLRAVFDIVRTASPVCTVCHFIRADQEPVFRFDISAFSSSYFADHFSEDNYE